MILKLIRNKKKLPLDGLKNYYGASYSVARKLRTGQLLSIRVRRSSDNSETDIGFKGNEMDVERLQSFCKSYNYTNIVTNGNFTSDSNSDGLADNFSVKGNLTSKSIGSNIQTFLPADSTGGISTVQTVPKPATIATFVMVKSASGSVKVGNVTGGGSATITTMDGTWKRIVNVQPVGDSTSTPYVQTNVSSGFVNIEVKEFMCIDLKPLGLESLTSAQLDTLFPFVESSGIANQSGYVVTLYDQTGNGNNLTQSDTTRQPRIVNAGTLETDNGKPCMYFDGTDVLQCSNSASIDINSQNLYVGLVFNVDVSVSADAIPFAKNTDALTTAQYACAFSNTNARLVIYLENTSRVNANQNSITRGIQSIQSFTWENNQVQCFDDCFASNTPGSYNGTLTSRNTLNLGARAAPTGTYSTFTKGKYAEFHIMRGNPKRLKFELEQKKFYNITT